MRSHSTSASATTTDAARSRRHRARRAAHRRHPPFEVAGPAAASWSAGARGRAWRGSWARTCWSCPGATRRAGDAVLRSRRLMALYRRVRLPGDHRRRVGGSSPAGAWRCRFARCGSRCTTSPAGRPASCSSTASRSERTFPGRGSRPPRGSLADRRGGDRGLVEVPVHSLAAPARGARPQPASSRSTAEPAEPRARPRRLSCGPRPRRGTGR